MTTAIRRKRHADHVGERAAVVLQHVLEGAVGAPDADVEGGEAPLGRQVEGDGLLSRQDLLHEGREKGLEGREIAAAGAPVRRLDERLDVAPGGKPPLGELDLAGQGLRALVQRVAVALGARQGGGDPGQARSCVEAHQRSVPSARRRVSTSRTRAAKSSTRRALSLATNSISFSISRLVVRPEFGPRLSPGVVQLAAQALDVALGANALGPQPLVGSTGLVEAAKDVRVRDASMTSCSYGSAHGNSSGFRRGAARDPPEPGDPSRPRRRGPATPANPALKMGMRASQ